MALSNYGELKTAIATRLARSNMTALIPDFITIAHAKMMRGDPLIGLQPLRIDDMQTDTTLTTSSGSVSLPSDYLELSSAPELDTTDSPVLKFLPTSTFRNLEQQGKSGTPTFYTIDGSTLKVAPNTDYDILVEYYAIITEPSADSDTNAIFTKAPHAYLYGALMEAYAHIRQFQNSSNYAAAFASAVNALNEESELHQFSGGPLRQIPTFVV